MKRTIVTYSLFIVSFLLELFVYPFPFVLLAAILVYLLFDTTESLLVIFLLGFLLDALRLQNAGVTGLFTFVTLVILKLYQAKFEVRSAPFISFLALVAVFLYGLYSGYEFVTWIYILIAICTFLFTTLIFTSRQKIGYE